jgi:hypothetical protein
MWFNMFNKKGIYIMSKSLVALAAAAGFAGLVVAGLPTEPETVFQHSETSEANYQVNNGICHAKIVTGTNPSYQQNCIYIPN